MIVIFVLSRPSKITVIVWFKMKDNMWTKTRLVVIEHIVCLFVCLRFYIIINIFIILYTHFAFW